MAVVNARSRRTHHILYSYYKYIFHCRGRIFGRNWEKIHKRFPPCYSQSPLLTEFTSSPPPHPEQKWFETGFACKHCIWKPQVWEISRYCNARNLNEIVRSRIRLQACCVSVVCFISCRTIFVRNFKVFNAWASVVMRSALCQSEQPTSCRALSPPALLYSRCTHSGCSLDTPSPPLLN